MTQSFFPVARFRHSWLLCSLAALALACGGGDNNEDPFGNDAEEHDHEHGDDHEHGELSAEQQGLQQCCQLGSLCHPGAPEDDPIGGLVRECHDIGHLNDPNECGARFDECLEACTGQREPLGIEEHGCVLVE